MGIWLQLFRDTGHGVCNQALLGLEHRRNVEIRFWYHNMRGTAPWKHSETVTKTMRQTEIRTHKDWLRDERKREHDLWAYEMELTGETEGCFYGIPREVIRASGCKHGMCSMLESRDGQAMLPALERENCLGLTQAIRLVLSVTAICFIGDWTGWFVLSLILCDCQSWPNGLCFGFNGLMKRLRSSERDLPTVSKQRLQNWIWKPSLVMLSPWFLFTVCQNF